MNLHRATELTRRTLLASLGGIAGVAVVSHTMAAEEKASDTDRRPKNMSQVREEFDRLLPLWQAERKHYSDSANTDDYWKGPHGKAMIALGAGMSILTIPDDDTHEMLEIGRLSRKGNFCRVQK